MMAFALQNAADLRRWVISAAIVVTAHGGIAATMVAWRDAEEPAEPAAAIVIDFAPVPVAPATLQTDIPPGPEQVMSDASPSQPTETVEEKVEEKLEHKVEVKADRKVEEQVERKPVEEPPPEVAQADNPEVPIEPPPPQQEVKQVTPPRVDPRAPAPVTTAPQAIPEETAAIPAAPTQGQVNPNNSKAVVTWKTQVLALIERNKRYPAQSQARREQGVAFVSFTIDRQGRVLDSRILRTSGAAALDEEALALLRRAQPFPKPPVEISGDSVPLSLPLRFNLK